jgi:hypothetical protein
MLAESVCQWSPGPCFFRDREHFEGVPVSKTISARGWGKPAPVSTPAHPQAVGAGGAAGISNRSRVGMPNVC